MPSILNPAAHLHGFDDPGHSYGIGCLTHVDVVLSGGGKDALVGHGHPLIQLLVDLIEGPAVAHDVLHHLKVRNGYAAGIGQEVGYDMHAVSEEDCVGFLRGALRSAFRELEL